MSLVTIIWSVAAGAALVLGLVHALVWGYDRRARGNLAFAIAALGSRSERSSRSRCCTPLPRRSGAKPSGGIFDPFFTAKTDGLGIGLSISRSIVEAHGGRLWAENCPDGGATFHFTVPLQSEQLVSPA